MSRTEQKIEDDMTTTSIEYAQESAARILGFAPLQLADDLYNVINDNLGSMIDDLGQKLVERHRLKLDPLRVEKLLNMLRKKMQRQQDHLFDEFEKYLVGDVFYVPPNVVLEEDKCQLNYSESQAHNVADRMETCTKRLTALNACQIIVETELEQQKALLTTAAKFKQQVTEAIQESFGVDSLDQLCLMVTERTKAVEKVCSELRKSQ